MKPQLYRQLMSNLMKRVKSSIEVIHLGLLEYSRTMEIQRNMVSERIAGKTRDCLLLVEHPSVVTIGRMGSENDLKEPIEGLHRNNISVFRSDRGGKATFHGPGQFVAYPIIMLAKKDLHWYVHTLLGSVADVIKEYGLDPEIKKGSPGIWIKGKKIASIGIATKKWVAYHGVALNVNTDLEGFKRIVPCGVPSQKITSMQNELGAPQDLSRVAQRFVHHFKQNFGFDEACAQRHPHWLTTFAFHQTRFDKMNTFLESMHLDTVCKSAHCPNIGECYGRGVATFMIMGSRCTRNCRFCAVEKGKPPPLDLLEPERIARAVKKLNLHYAVITSVTRDDIGDGGAAHFADTVRCIRKLCPGTLVEILVPDFQGNATALEAVCFAKPDMFNHNIETIPHLYPLVRPGADYYRSLNVLKSASQQKLPVKSGLMLGLGELKEEVESTLEDLRKVGCEYLTVGQYLSPSKNHLPVARYIPPSEFEQWRAMATKMGFKQVASGPRVRSSYRADEYFRSSGQISR